MRILRAMPDDINTGGGSHVGGDVSAGRDFVGRDKITNIYNAARDYTRSAWHMLSPIPEHFVGRADEIERVLALARQPNLRDGAVAITSLTGMGGIGKTALANVTAHALRKDYPDGELMFELKGHSLSPRTPEQELDIVLRKMLDVPYEAKLPDDLPTLRKYYLDALFGKRCVVIIDDARTDGEVDALRPPSGCVALITSRRQLARGQRVPVKKLNRAESVAVLRGYRETLSADEADAIASACADHPLALNVAGAYLRRRETTSAERYLQALGQDRLKTFDAGRGDNKNADTESVDAVFDFSFKSLTDEQQADWLALSVMSTNFDRAAGVAVCGADEDELDHPLDTLVEYNLLEYDPATQRFAWHDLLKEFADHRQSNAQRIAAQRRHATYFTQVGNLADQLYLQGGENVVRGLTLFDRERAHLEAAFETLRGLKAHRELIKLVDVVTYTSDLRFHPRQCIDWLEAQREAAHASGHKQAEGSALGNLGGAYAGLGDATRGIEFYEQALVIDREIGDRGGEGTALGNLGTAYWALGDAQRAIGFYEQQLEIVREIGDRRGEGTALGNLGVAYHSLGDVRRAIEFYEQHLVIAREIGDRGGEGIALGNLGAAYYSLGDASRAIEFYEQSIVIKREIGNRQGEADTSWNLGMLYEAQGDLARAVELMQVRVDFLREITHPDVDKDAAGVAAIRAKMSS
ncbi:MAG TPA: tetratricopeptide repeat protein [Thermoflexales bacterium]|nr:tetratricopeptide repeat protein [Thermoflexales bacterium]